MITRLMTRHLVPLIACALLAGCAGTKPAAYNGIASSPYLTPDPDDASDRTPYRYAARVNWNGYRKLVLDNVSIYKGTDHQFADISEGEKTELATYMQARFAEKLGTRFQITDSPAPDTLRVALTLTGAEKTTPVLGTVSRFDLLGGVYNGVQSFRDREGTFTGSVIYAVEVYDAQTSRLLMAYISRQYPNPMNIGASIGALEAAKTGIEKGAEDIVDRLK